MRKKLLAGVLAASMVISMAACGDNGEATPTAAPTQAAATQAPNPTKGADPTATPVPTKAPLKVTVALPSDEEHLEANADYDRLVKELNEYLNMDITWEWQAQATYYDAEHLGLKLSTGDVADVLVVGKDATFLAAAEEGLFWDLAPYIDQFDNLATIPQATRENASYNGKMYGIPRSRTLARNGIGYRVDWLNNLGLAEPTTLEAFEEMLEKFTYNDPDGNGVDDTVGLGLDSWTGVYDIMQVWFGVPNVWGLDKNGNLVHKYETEEYKTSLKKFREWFSNGWINNGSNGIEDFINIKAGKARDTLQRNGLAGVGVQVLDDQRKVETYFEQNGMATEDEPIYTLQGYVDTGLGAFCFPTTGMNNMIAISTKNIKTEDQLLQVLGMLNDINDGVCMNLIEYGWEGLTYRVDDDGYTVIDFTNEERTAAGVGSTTYSNGFNQVIPYFTAEENARPVARAAGNTAITILEQQLYAEDIQYCVPNYGASYTSETYVAKGADLDKIMADAQQAFIRGEIEEVALDEAIKSWKAAGGDQVTKEMNDLYKAAHK